MVPFPLVDARFRDRVYLGPSSTGIGFALGAYPIQSSRWRIAVELGGQDSRPADRADALAGMEDRDLVATAGVSLSYRNGPFEGIVAVSQGLNDGAGLIQTTRVVYYRPVGKVILGAAAGAALANGKQMRREFGITDAEAARRQALADAGDGRLEPGDAQALQPGWRTASPWPGGLAHLPRSRPAGRWSGSRESNGWPTRLPTARWCGSASSSRGEWGWGTGSREMSLRPPTTLTTPAF